MPICQKEWRMAQPSAYNTAEIFRIAMGSFFFSEIVQHFLNFVEFFFAGLLAVQTFKRYGKRFSIVTAVGMTISFFIFEVLLLNFLRIPFAGTVMIITGWAPLVIIKELSRRKPEPSKM